MAQYVLFEGIIDDFEVDPHAPAKDFTVQALDSWGRPGGEKLSTPVYQGKRTGDLIGIVLDLIDWPTGAYRNIDAGNTLVPYWWLEDVDAATAIADIVASEGQPAVAFVQGGVFYYRDRLHRARLTASTTSQGTYTHTIPAGAVTGDYKIIAGSFVYQHGLKDIINSATLEVTPRLPFAREVVWATDDPLALGPNEAATFVIRADDPFIDLQTPADTTDPYAYNDIPYKTDYTLAAGTVSFSLSRTSGQSTFLTITGGGSGAVLSGGVRLRGTPLKQGATTRKFSASDSNSQAVYGSQNWPDSAAPWTYYYDAQAIVDRIVAGYAQPRPSVTFDVDGAVSADTLTRILNTAISDRITVRNDDLGLNADFHIEQLTHTILKLGVRHTLTIGAQTAEQLQASNPFTFDVSDKGFGQGQFSLSIGNNPASMLLFDTSLPALQGFGAGAFAT